MPSDVDLSYHGSVTAEAQADQEKLVASLRAAVSKKGWSASAAVTVTKYLAAGAVGAAVTFAATYVW